MISNVNYYKNYLKERDKKGIVLYKSNIIKKEQLLSTRNLKAIDLDDFIIFAIKDLKKDTKLYYFCLANIDYAYSEYLYLMYLMEKIISTQSKKKNNLLDLLISKKKNK